MSTEKEITQYKNNINRVKAMAIIFYVICLIVFLLWACFPLLNTIYSWEDGTGAHTDFRYRASWWFIFLIALNLVLPYLGFLVLANPYNVSRSDLYFIFSIVLIFVNVVAIAAFTFYWLFYTNTVYTGKEPFNDYRWCCVFFIDHPELCPNNGFFPCMPSVASTDLVVNTEFILHWITSIIFFVFAIWHYAINKLFHVTGVVRQTSKAKFEGLLLGAIFIFINLGLFLYWAAVPLLNTLYLNGYPRFAVPPSPNNFESTLYGFQWWMIWLLVLNIFPIMIFLLALTSNKNFFTPWLHYWTAVIVIIISLVVTLVLGGIWIFNCNWSYSALSICKSYLWCCTNFANAPTICPNTTPCPQSVNLCINAEFLQHFIFSIVFWVFTGIQIWLSRRMKHYGVFYSHLRDQYY